MVKRLLGFKIASIKGVTPLLVITALTSAFALNKAFTIFSLEERFTAYINGVLPSEFTALTSAPAEINVCATSGLGFPVNKINKGVIP
ncbi:MAG: hypothetical protein BWY78_00524 [Alphaproteobacteria bacterium ADurb.Bin438]|nr:MAG: hypothetical protein BWY78_00524 [Alphaproteobacteria bacterium ADurb.Bin438]